MWMMIPMPQYVPMLSHFSIIAVVIHLIFAGEVALNPIPENNTG
jgi:energy-converting hydrogenase Eha subunit H